MSSQELSDIWNTFEISGGICGEVIVDEKWPNGSKMNYKITAETTDYDSTDQIEYMNNKYSSSIKILKLSFQRS